MARDGERSQPFDDGFHPFGGLQDRTRPGTCRGVGAALLDEEMCVPRGNGKRVVQFVRHSGRQSAYRGQARGLKKLDLQVTPVVGIGNPIGHVGEHQQAAFAAVEHALPALHLEPADASAPRHDSAANRRWGVHGFTVTRVLQHLGDRCLVSRKGELPNLFRCEIQKLRSGVLKNLRGGRVAVHNAVFAQDEESEQRLVGEEFENLGIAFDLAGQAAHESAEAGEASAVTANRED